ncbi:hypothetical protein [Lactococcus protaetiae]|uniref:HTH cro/C1-type domain-containing protein n=1 Tax=Lactococcus protaetiae TaxID=2592653 RepID=A0A514Z7Z8_9LACT|nr:hypothetical protein [Lactococcus protaetiae]QDK70716.1 hypothetical protein FLP15_05565 [Lactococcus protaetiae]
MIKKNLLYKEELKLINKKIRKLRIPLAKLSKSLEIPIVRLSDILSSKVETDRGTIQNLHIFLGMREKVEETQETPLLSEVRLNKEQTKIFFLFVRKIMKERRLTIIKLAQGLDMEVSTVSDILYFRRGAPGSFIKALAQFLRFEGELTTEVALFQLLECHGYEYSKEESTVIAKRYLEPKLMKFVQS